MQQVIVDCASGQTEYVALTPEEQAAQAAQQQVAQQQLTAQEAERAFRQLQLDALRGSAVALHGGHAGADAAALAGLVAKLTADPPLPLSAPALSTLARVVLRCLLP